MPGIALEIRRKCKVCGKVFLVKKLDSQFCSKRCGDVYRKRIKDANKREERLSEIILHIPDDREYISVKEAVAIFGVERDTIYRLIKKGKIPAINLGTRLTRIKRDELEKLLPTRQEIKKESEKPVPKLYSLEPEDCYTIGEICKKYHINDSTVWSHVRKYSIPSRQIGNYVYIPKEEIDNLYKSDV
ncbi:helix-turn-helix domain-containing protein [Prevotella nigrescens]|uniref:helix-turn-helix domain-containing protein n=1 Tax=Prevotella nigrescens TaxID=28133 RepID=UPI0002AECF56|nr:helix-turn-helix domain-containing protein [Prevotella nigrescens]ELX68026.1 excisionase family DNA binding domain-containing protein [Prevotella nigrescens F0103]QUB53953.1 helix-turn-helix domain-containing protein [Prevotella nigrescens F0103]